MAFDDADPSHSLLVFTIPTLHFTLGLARAYSFVWDVRFEFCREATWGSYSDTLICMGLIMQF